MAPLTAVALMFLCATPALSDVLRDKRSPSGFHHQTAYSFENQAVAASNIAPVVQTKASYKGCSSGTGCSGITLENGQITEQFGNPAALGIHGEVSDGLDPSEIHKKFALQAADINSAFAANLPLNGPYWWASKDSPFRDTYETYMKWIKENGFTMPAFTSPCGTSTCPFGSSFSSEGKVSTSDGGISNSIDIANNPFLNGQFASAAGFSGGSSGFTAGSAGFDASKNPFLNGDINLPGFGAGQGNTDSFSSSFGSTTGNVGSFGTGELNIAANPFLNGAISGGNTASSGCGGPKSGCGGSSNFQSGSVSYQQSGAVPTQTTNTVFSSNLNKNTFVSDQFNKPTGGSTLNTIQVTGTASNIPSQQVNTGYHQVQTTGCAGGAGCGFQNQQKQVVTNFEQVQTNGCSGPFCGPSKAQQPIPVKPPGNLPHPPGFTATGFKESGQTNGELTVTCTGQGFICVARSLCVNGFVNDDGENILQARSGIRCKASTEVCCQFKQKPSIQTTSQTFTSNHQAGTKIESASLTGSGLIHVPGTATGSHVNTGYITSQGSGQQSNFGQTGFDQQVYTNNFQNRPANDVRPPFTNPGQVTGYNKDSVSSQTQEQYFSRPTFGNNNKAGTPYLPPEDNPKAYIYPEPKKPFVDQKPTPRPQPKPTTYNPPAPKPTPYVPPAPKPTRYVPPAPKPTPFVRPTTGPAYLPPKDDDESPQPSSGSQQVVPGPIPDTEGGIILDETRNLPPKGTPIVPSGCAAALKCTPKEFCTADGIISNITIRLTKEQEDFRVPLTDCKEPTTGVSGKCCRDPTYTDPWPTNQLGQWIPGAFGDTGAYRADQHRGNPNRGPNGSNNGPRNTDTSRPFNQGFGSNPAGSINNPIYAANPNQIYPTKNTNQFPGNPTRPILPSVQVNNPVNPGVFGNINLPDNRPKNNNNYPSTTGQVLSPGKQVYPGVGAIVKPNFSTVKGGKTPVSSNPNSQVNTENVYTTGELLLSNFNQAKEQKFQAESCGVRKGGTRPYGNKEQFEVDFAEIPWQAMVLLQTNRSLLCGGVITSEDIVVTSAHCIDGLDAKNVLIKGGEWKLGVDEEPRPFQIVQVAKIHKHPQYFTGSLQNDFAILVLSEKLRLAPNIAPICLPPASQEAELRLYRGSGYKCITTGWGKQVLQVNIPNSIMHSIDMNLISPPQCQAQITQNYPHLLENYNSNTCICGQPRVPQANVCKVDIGSALACTNGDGTYYMEGVFSWDSGCQSSNQLAAFFKFDSLWYHSAITGAANLQAQLFQQQQFVTNSNNGRQQFAAENQNQQQAQFSTQYKQTITKTGQSYALNGQKAFEQAIGGHLHTGPQCQCYEEGKK